MRVRPFTDYPGLAIWCIFLTAAAFAQSHTSVKPPHPAQNLTPDEMFKRVAKSVFVVEAVDTHGDVLFQQSGVAISPHVIASTKAILGEFGNVSDSSHKIVARYVIRQNYRTWNVNNVFVDPVRDVSTFESSDLSADASKTDKSDSVAVGETIYAISFPKGQEESLTEGKVSGSESADHSVPIDTTISLGLESAGGGLFSAKGNLIGLVAYERYTSLNHGIPCEWLFHSHILYSGAQAPDARRDSTSELMRRASVVSNNIAEFAGVAMSHQGKDFTESEEHQAVNEVIVNATMVGLIDKDSPESYDNWPVWRQALASMELIRTEIKSASESGAMEMSDSGIQEVASRNLRSFVDSGRKMWSDVLDVYCSQVPSGPYTDLDGKQRACAPVP
jgi:hypothetical protein